MREVVEPVIGCITFREQERILRDITDRINLAGGAQDRIRLAKNLNREVDVLVSCPAYDNETFDCRNCRFVSNLRRKTAAVFMRLDAKRDN